MKPPDSAGTGMTASSVITVIAQGEWEAIRAHPWMLAARQNSLPDTALAEWAQQTRLLCRWELRVLGTLRSYDLPAGMAELLKHLSQDTEHGIGWLERLLSALGHQPAGDGDAWPQCIGYSAYLWSCAGNGLLEGIAATHASELTYLRTCQWLHPELPEDSRLREWFSGWADQGFRNDVASLGAWLDELAGLPSQATLDRLMPMLRYVARFERAFWDMCWTGQAWPAPCV